MFTQPADKIVYCYSIMQDNLLQLQIDVPDKVILNQGLPSQSLLDSLDHSKVNILVMDDMARQVCSSPYILDLVVAGCHHQKLSSSLQLYCVSFPILTGLLC